VELPSVGAGGEGSAARCCLGARLGCSWASGQPASYIHWDASRPDGTPRKLLDVAPMRALGWEPAITLADGIRATWEEYAASVAG
jgi:nucleoside-diphosphate-sugar epimerase